MSNRRFLNRKMGNLRLTSNERSMRKECEKAIKV
uniref:Uncharacterized protein n=1 Tax=Anguilla anguilla TaxID=7936 RepID=A0A0E9UUL0_ANGAN